MVVRLDKIANVDDVHASILINDEVGMQEIKIANGYSMRDELFGVRQGDVFNIRGIGRLKVLQVVTHPTENQFINIVEIIISCRWVSDWWDYKTRAMVSNLLEEANRQRVVDEVRARTEEIKRRDFHMAWGWETEYVE